MSRPGASQLKVTILSNGAKHRRSRGMRRRRPNISSERAIQLWSPPLIEDLLRVSESPWRRSDSKLAPLELTSFSLAHPIESLNGSIQRSIEDCSFEVFDLQFIEELGEYARDELATIGSDEFVGKSESCEDLRYKLIDSEGN